MLVGSLIDASYQIKQEWFSFGERTQLGSWVHYPKETGLQVAGTKIFEELRKSKKKKKYNNEKNPISSTFVIIRSFFTLLQNTHPYIHADFWKNIYVFYIIPRSWKKQKMKNHTIYIKFFEYLLIYNLIYSPIVFRYLSRKFFARRLIYY